MSKEQITLRDAIVKCGVPKSVLLDTGYADDKKTVNANVKINAQRMSESFLANYADVYTM